MLYRYRFYCNECENEIFQFETYMENLIENMQGLTCPVCDTWEDIEIFEYDENWERKE